ncbi:hypothetical protein, partial [Variovorax paradoxus]|uniref:hypothetical protein n=1 Tax=Variovorax paradoxus TaxID=34073 RepID=UPI001ABC1033
LRVLSEGAPNSQDPHGEGVSRESLGLFFNVYDRLVNFDRAQLAALMDKMGCQRQIDLVRMALSVA